MNLLEDLQGAFVAECANILESIEASLSFLVESPRELDHLTDVRRGAHTLVGNATLREEHGLARASRALLEYVDEHPPKDGAIDADVLAAIRERAHEAGEELAALKLRPRSGTETPQPKRGD